MHYAQNTYNQLIAESTVKDVLADFYIDLLSFCIILKKLVVQKMDGSQTEPNSHPTNLTGNNTIALVATPLYRAEYPETYLSANVRKLRRWIACMGHGRGEKKKFNEESNHHSFVRKSDPDRTDRAWRACSVIHRIRRKPTHRWQYICSPGS